MASVIAAGAAAVDFVMTVDALPTRAEKYRARDAAVVGGGCAATAAVAVARLGGTARLATRLGEDEVGAMIVAGLLAEGVDCTLVRRFGGCRSSFSTVLVDAAGDRQIVNFRDPALPAGAAWLETAPLARFGAALADTRWPEGALALMARARAAGVPGVIDAEAPVVPAADALRLASHVVFSAQGLRDFTGREDLADGLASAEEATGAWVAVTDGAAGALWRAGGTVRRAPAFGIRAVDTLGAGDVWHGAFALGLAEGQDETGAIRFAHAAAALKCTRPGGRAGTPNRAEVEAFLKETTECS
ncbi:MAG: sugar kinase [Rhodobacteraceae bacterium]|jgi:sulfofructose kinase|nr:sugar kinase [Paracoccaceae bacterium]